MLSLSTYTYAYTYIHTYTHKGCNYGRLIAVLMQPLYGSSLDPGTYALVGAASMLGGATRMTMYVFVYLCVCL